MLQQSRGQLGEVQTFQKVVGHANHDILQQLGLRKPLDISSGELRTIYYKVFRPLLILGKKPDLQEMCLYLCAIVVMISYIIMPPFP